MEVRPNGFVPTWCERSYSDGNVPRWSVQGNTLSYTCSHESYITFSKSQECLEKTITLMARLKAEIELLKMQVQNMPALGIVLEEENNFLAFVNYFYDNQVNKIANLFNERIIQERGLFPAGNPDYDDFVNLDLEEVGQRINQCSDEILKSQHFLQTLEFNSSSSEENRAIRFMVSVAQEKARLKEEAYHRLLQSTQDRLINAYSRKRAFESMLRRPMVKPQLPPSEDSKSMNYEEAVRRYCMLDRLLSERIKRLPHDNDLVKLISACLSCAYDLPILVDAYRKKHAMDFELNMALGNFPAGIVRTGNETVDLVQIQKMLTVFELLWQRVSRPENLLSEQQEDEIPRTPIDALMALAASTPPSTPDVSAGASFSARKKRKTRTEKSS